MKLTLQQVLDVTVVVSTIIREQRPLPTKGKYRLARMHAKLLPEFNVATAQRDALIKAYDFHEMVPPAPSAEDPLGQGMFVPSEQFSVPPDKIEEFNAAWAPLAAETIEIDVEPIPLHQLDLGYAQDGGIHANEFIALGNLVIDDLGPPAP